MNQHRNFQRILRIVLTILVVVIEGRKLGITAIVPLDRSLVEAGDTGLSSRGGLAVKSRHPRHQNMQFYTKDR